MISKRRPLSRSFCVAKCGLCVDQNAQGFKHPGSMYAFRRGTTPPFGPVGLFSIVRVVPANVQGLGCAVVWVSTEDAQIFKIGPTEKDPIFFVFLSFCLPQTVFLGRENIVGIQEVQTDTKSHVSHISVLEPFRISCYGCVALEKRRRVRGLAASSSVQGTANGAGDPVGVGKSFTVSLRVDCMCANFHQQAHPSV